VTVIFSIHELEEGDKIPGNNYLNFHFRDSSTFPAEGHKKYKKNNILEDIRGIMDYLPEPK